ncbi:probable CSC1-like protein ERD4 at C-terminar half [Coccomyxa sp. Obi]|nr:probable CSC1-like protein ERD4 at C-terminar half [Coccomyxa sp. Obi]
MSFLGNGAFGTQSEAAPAPGNSSMSPPGPYIIPGGGQVAALFAQNNQYTDRQVTTGAVFNLVFGVACILGFILFRAFGVDFYKARMLLPEILDKPPVMSLRFPRVFWSWLRPVFAVSDAELMRTAGLDALIFHRAYTFGILFFGPVTVLSCALLLPIYATGPRLKRNPDVTFSKFTMSNLELASPLYWITLVYVVLVIAYGQWLLMRFYKEYVELHQRYLVRGEQMLNEWQLKKIPRRTGSVGVRANPKLLAGMHEDGADAPKQEEEMQRLGDKEKSSDGVADESGDYQLGNASTPLKTIDWSPDALKAHPISPHETVEKSEDSVDPPREGARILRWWRPSAVLMTSAGRPVHVARPPVPFRKIVSTLLPDGEEVSVNAQQYVVLVTDVPEPPKANVETPPSRMRAFWETLPALRLPWMLTSCGGPFTADLSHEVVSKELVRADSFAPSSSAGDLIRRASEPASQNGANQNGANGKDKDRDGDRPDPELGVRGATEHRGTHTGHFELEPVHKMFMRRLSSPGLRPVAEESPRTSLNRSSSKASAPGASGRPVEAFSVEQGPSAGEGGRTNPGITAAARWKGLATAFQTASTASAIATAKASELPESKTGPHGSAAAAAAAVDANASEGVAEGAEVDLGGQGLVEAVFKGMFPEAFQEVVPVRNHKALDMLLFKWDDAYRLLEIAQANYLASEKTKRPTHRLGCCGCSGETVDSINHYCAQIRSLETKILEERERLLKEPPVTNSYFVLFNSQTAAAAAAQCCIFPEGAADAFRVMPAPGPEEVNWQVLWVNRRKRIQLRFAGWVLLTVVILFPIGLFTGAVTTCTNAICTRQELADNVFCRSTSKFKSLITGVLPPLLLTLWQNLFMPQLIYLGAQLLCRKYSLSGLDRLILSLFFIWGILSVLIGGIVGGSILTYLSPEFISHPDRIYDFIGPSLSSASNLFINYIIFQGFFMIPYRLFSPTFFPLITILRKIKILPWPKGTRAEMEALWPHFNIRMGCELGRGFMLICCITLANAAVSPIILPFALWYFIASWVMWRYSILYVFERSSESGGMMWHQIFDKLIWCFFIFGFFTGSVMITNKAIIQGAILIVFTPIWMRIFYNYASERFGRERSSSPLLLAAGAPPATIDPAIYTAPALRPGCAGWYPEYNKAWEHWGMPAYAF